VAGKGGKKERKKKRKSSPSAIIHRPFGDSMWQGREEGGEKPPCLFIILGFVEERMPGLGDKGKRREGGGGKEGGSSVTANCVSRRTWAGKKRRKGRGRPGNVSFFCRHTINGGPGVSRGGKGGRKKKKAFFVVVEFKEFFLTAKSQRRTPRGGKGKERGEKEKKAAPTLCTRSHFPSQQRKAAPQTGKREEEGEVHPDRLALL